MIDWVWRLSISYQLYLWGRALRFRLGLLNESVLWCSCGGLTLNQGPRIYLSSRLHLIHWSRSYHACTNLYFGFIQEAPTLSHRRERDYTTFAGPHLCICFQKFNCKLPDFHSIHAHINLNFTAHQIIGYGINPSITAAKPSAKLLHFVINRTW